MPVQVNRNNILAGAFLLSALILFVVTSFIIRQLDFEPKTAYIVRFTLATGAQGLNPGAVVRLGGQPVGEVRRLSFHPSEDEPTHIDVRVEIDADIVLFENARVYLQRQLLGSGSDLNIAAVGDAGGVSPAEAQGAGPRLEEGEVLTGLAAPPSFLADAGWGENESRALPRIVANVEQTTADTRDLLAEARRWWSENEPRLSTTTENFRSLSDQARAFGDDLPDRRETIRAALDDVRGFTEGLGPFLDNANGAVDNADDGIADVRKIIADLDAAIERNRPEVDATIDATRATAERLRDATVPQLEQGVREFDDAFARLGALIDSEAPVIRATLANGRLASDQLKLTMIEVRNQPWRLLIAPATKELERQLLYDAARSYATAVSDLRGASASLESVLAGGQANQRAREIETITAELRDAFERYQKTEQTLLDVLMRETRGE